MFQCVSYRFRNRLKIYVEYGWICCHMLSHLRWANGSEWWCVGCPHWVRARYERDAAVRWKSVSLLSWITEYPCFILLYFLASNLWILSSKRRLADELPPSGGIQNGYCLRRTAWTMRPLEKAQKGQLFEYLGTHHEDSWRDWKKSEVYVKVKCPLIESGCKVAVEWWTGWGVERHRGTLTSSSLSKLTYLYNMCTICVELFSNLRVKPVKPVKSLQLCDEKFTGRQWKRL